MNPQTQAIHEAFADDAKTLILHPASTIFHEFDEMERQRMGVYDDMVRVSVGIEDIRDITSDFDQAFAAVAATQGAMP